MNGTFLGDLPGAQPAWVGRTAMHLTSLPSLQERASAAGLGTSSAGSGVAHIVDALAQGPPRVARAANIVGEFGRAVGHLIATLKLSPPAAPYSPEFQSPGTRPPSAWRIAYVHHWAGVERIWLGGGLTAALGTAFVDDARAELERLGVRGCALELAPYADVLALVGAARSRRLAPPVGVVLDFGGSTLKRGVALAHAGAVERLEVLESRPAPALGTAGVTNVVVEAIADTFLEAQRTWGAVDPYIAVSVASYVVDGRPISAHGTYGSLAHVEPRQLEADLQQRTAAPIRVELLHDGTAAARGLTNQPDQAGLIVLGTYLTAGFPPPSPRLAPLADGFRVQRGSERRR